MGFREYGTVIVGYQGVGKSTLSFHNPQVIDLESSNFFVDGKRSGDWYIPYCNIARALCRQGFVVCVSSHKVVRDELRNKPAINQVIVYPSLSLKDKWINMLLYRWEASSTDKNYKAYQNALYQYDENITDLMNEKEFIHAEISDMNYDLSSILKLNQR